MLPAHHATRIFRRSQSGKRCASLVPEAPTYRPGPSRASWRILAGLQSHHKPGS
jgi:hypothetical protein